MENKKEIGFVDMVKVNESIESIEFLTTQYKKRRMTTASYVKLIRENLNKLSSERDYFEYLHRIGQK